MLLARASPGAKFPASNCKGYFVMAPKLLGWYVPPLRGFGERRDPLRAGTARGPVGWVTLTGFWES